MIAEILDLTLKEARSNTVEPRVVILSTEHFKEISMHIHEYEGALAFDTDGLSAELLSVVGSNIVADEGVILFDRIKFQADTAAQFIINWMFPAAVVLLKTDSLVKFTEDLFVAFAKKNIFLVNNDNVDSLKYDAVKNKAPATLILYGLDLDTLVHPEIWSDINWSKFKYIYFEGDNRENEKLYLKLKQDLASVGKGFDKVVLSMQGTGKIDANEIAQLKRQFDIVDLANDENVKEFMQNPVEIATVDEMLELYNKLYMSYCSGESKPLLLYSYMIDKIFRNGKRKKSLENVLAMLHINTGVYIASEKGYDVEGRVMQHILRLNARPWGTLKERIMPHISAMRAMYASKGGKPNLLVCLTNHLKLNFCTIHRIEDETEVHMIPWDFIRNNLTYEQQKFLFTIRVDSDVSCKQVDQPVFTSKLSIQDQNPRMTITNLSDLLGYCEFLDLDELDPQYALFTGADTKWDGRGLSTDVSVNNTKIKYAFWSEVCRVFEQLVLEPREKDGKLRGYQHYISVRDLMLIRDKESDTLYLAYAKPKFIYTTKISFKGFRTGREIENLNFASLYSVLDSVDGAVYSEDGLTQVIHTNLRQSGQEIPEDQNIVALDYDIFSSLPGDNKALRRAFYYCQSTQVGPYERLDKGSGLDIFERELSDSRNLEVYDKCDEYAKIINPYSFRIVQPIVNIFGGFNFTVEATDQFIEFSPIGEKKTLQVNISPKHFKKCPE